MLWYSLLPSLLTTVVGIGYLLYQFFAFKRSHWFDNAETSFIREVITYVANFFQTHTGLITPIIIIFIIAVILYFLVPTICLGGLVQITARRREGKEVQNIDGISYGLMSFLVLLEYHLFIKTFSFIGIFTEAALVLRNFEEEMLGLFIPIFGLFLVIGLFLTLLFIYAEFFIILKREGILRSILKSSKLVMLNWRHTFLIGLVMLMIGVRIIVNIVAVLLVPALIIVSAGFFATIALQKIGLIVALIIGFFALIAVAYFNGIIHLFTNTVWTYTFMDLCADEKNKEFIE